MNWLPFMGNMLTLKLILLLVFAPHECAVSKMLATFPMSTQEKDQEQNQHHQLPQKPKINHLETLHLNYIKSLKFLVKDAYGS
jgi:flagellar basal body-associated protein FliL